MRDLVISLIIILLTYFVYLSTCDIEKLNKKIKNKDDFKNTTKNKNYQKINTDSDTDIIDDYQEKKMMSNDTAFGVIKNPIMHEDITGEQFEKIKCQNNKYQDIIDDEYITENYVGNKVNDQQARNSLSCNNCITSNKYIGKRGYTY